MDTNNSFRCVNCGKPTEALYKSYGPSVLKLTKCEWCGETTDKYVEYDSVIVVIDLVLASKQAQRHVLYNTEFKLYWKLFIILTLLETYGVWRNESFATLLIQAACREKEFSIWGFDLGGACRGWAQAGALGAQGGADDDDLFIWEKDFYVYFVSTLCGTLAFLVVTCGALRVLERCGLCRKVPLKTSMKAFCLAHTSLLLTIPMLVWGAAAAAPPAPPGPPAAAAQHCGLVFAYCYVMFLSVYTVVCPAAVHGGGAGATGAVLAAGFGAKLCALFAAAAVVRDLAA